jgi:hypothetical protein
MNHCLVYDQTDQRLFLFGGMNGDGYLGDLWEYDMTLQIWTQLQVPGESPSPRSEHAMGYDPLENRLIVYGGGSWESGNLADTWIYDISLSRWHKVGGFVCPLNRGFAAMAYDSKRNRMLLFGGLGARFFGDTWSFDLTMESWSELKPSGQLPAPRCGAASAYDPTTDRVMLVGGVDERNELVSDAWHYVP